MGRSNHGYPSMILLHHNLGPVPEFLQHGGEVVRHLGVGHADLFHIFNHTSCSSSPACAPVIGRAAHTHFFSLHCWKAASVSRVSAAISSGSGSVLKLKHVLPCIRFFKAGVMRVSITGHMYSGIR